MDLASKVIFVKGLHELSDLVLEDKIEIKALAARLKGAADWVESLEAFELEGKKAKRKVNEPTDDEIHQVFAYWQSATKRPSTKLTPARRAKIRARLADGFSVEDLCSVVDYASESEFHQGRNDRGNRYDWLESILRSTERVEQHLEKRGESRPANVAHDDLGELARLESDADEALDEGRIDEYNKIQGTIETLRTASK